MQDNYLGALRMLVERRVNCVRRRKDLLRYYCKPSDQHCHQSLAEFFHGRRSNNQQCRFREEQVRSNERSHSKNSRNEKKQLHPTYATSVAVNYQRDLVHQRSRKKERERSRETLFGEE